MKQIIKWFLKAFVAGVLALAVASAGCLLYYNPGIRQANPSGATDYTWQSNCFTGGMTEGIAWSYTDANGFYNKDGVDKNMDILVMGSSQMEGRNVFPEERTAWLLGEMTGKTVYSIGTSGHELLVCVKNLEAALSTMQPSEYVIIEIGSVEYSAEEIDKCLSGKMETIASYDRGLLYQMQKITYLRLVYAQMKSWNGAHQEDATVAQTSEAATKNDASPTEAYERLTARIQEVCGTHGVQPILIYHPNLHVNADGTVFTDYDPNALNELASACRVNGVLFVDMTEDFLRLYDAERVLPHGFCNTAVGAGHLNRRGHQAIAERLTEVINGHSAETEEKK